MDKPQSSRLPELIKRTILMLNQSNPEWGVERISAMLLRGPGLQPSPSAVAKVLHEAGYELEDGADQVSPRQGAISGADLLRPSWVPVPAVAVPVVVS
jgi:hypothetical protein